MQVEAVQEAVDGLVPSCSADSVRHCIAQLRPLSMGALKSCLQKVIRFHAVAVDYGECIPSPLLAATATGLLFANRGGFSPELQLFTRGATAAFKRLAVILLEDAWVKEDKTPSCVAALLASGLVTQRVADYEPPRSSVVAAMRMAARAAASSCIIAWRQKENRVSKASAQVRKADEHINVSKEQATLFQHSAKLLHLLRSFSGDMAMFDQVAAASKAGKLPLQHAAKRPEVPCLVGNALQRSLDLPFESHPEVRSVRSPGHASLPPRGPAHLPRHRPRPRGRRRVHLRFALPVAFQQVHGFQPAPGRSGLLATHTLHTLSPSWPSNLQNTVTAHGFSWPRKASSPGLRCRGPASLSSVASMLRSRSQRLCFLSSLMLGCW